MTMAHFAELDETDTVIRVVVVANEVTHATVDGTEDQSLGVAFLKDLLGGEWIGTSYNNNFRKRYAGIGYTYDRERDEFVPPNYVLENGEWIDPNENVTAA